MRKTRTEIVPATTREVVDSIHCDLCGAEIMHFGSSYDEITVQRSVGYRYPDCASSETTSYDVCPPCFESRIVPIFAGATPTETESCW